jgi:hypothetical protein
MSNNTEASMPKSWSFAERVKQYTNAELYDQWDDAQADIYNMEQDIALLAVQLTEATTKLAVINAEMKVRSYKESK